ncbi:Endothelin-converting enzyme 1, partial [Stegodyphus mimosarum]
MGINERTRLKDDSVPRNLCPATTRMEKGLLVIVLLVVAVGIGLTIALVAYYRGDPYDVTHPSLEKISPPYCLTVSCITTAADIISSMDETKKPCEDFYKYVCGNWIKRSPMVGSITSQFTKLNRLTTMRLKEILEELQKTSELEEHHSKAKNFYSACMETETNSTKDLLSDLQSFGRWPVIDNKWNNKQFDWVDLMGAFKKSGYIYDMLLTIFVRPDVKNTSSTLIAIYPPTLGTDLSYFTMDDLITTYQDGIIHIAKSLAPDLNETIAEEEIKAAYQIERRLANVSIETMKKGNPDIYYNIRTIKELENFAPKIPWLKLLRKLLTSDANITRNERIMIAKPEAIRTLNTILGELNDEKG